MVKAQLVAALLAVALAATSSVNTRPALATSAADINRDANAVLAKLYAQKPEAKKLASQAKAILIFPSIYKAGFMFGAQYGEGVLRKGNKSVGYYNTVAASYGWQAGAQAFGYALFFMNDSASATWTRAGIRGRNGAEHRRPGRGHGKVDDELDRDARHLRVIFDQKGLMAGAGLKGRRSARSPNDLLRVVHRSRTDPAALAGRIRDRDPLDHAERNRHALGAREAVEIQLEPRALPVK
jgi:lipid-binding SYLF domain-containing protein